MGIFLNVIRSIRMVSSDLFGAVGEVCFEHYERPGKPFKWMILYSNISHLVAVAVYWCGQLCRCRTFPVHEDMFIPVICSNLFKTQVLFSFFVVVIFCVLSFTPLMQFVGCLNRFPACKSLPYQSGLSIWQCSDLNVDQKCSCCLFSVDLIRLMKYLYYCRCDNSSMG